MSMSKSFPLSLNGSRISLSAIASANSRKILMATGFFSPQKYDKQAGFTGLHNDFPWLFIIVTFVSSVWNFSRCYSVVFVSVPLAIIHLMI